MISPSPDTSFHWSIPRAVLDSLPEPLGIYSAIRDSSGRIVDFCIEYVNPAVVAANRIPAEQQIGRRLCEILPAHRSTGLFEEYCRVTETGVPLEKNEWLYHDDLGEKTVIAPSLFRIRAWKTGDGFTATWRVLSEISAEALERTRAVIDSLAAFVGILTPEGILIEANRAALEAAGLSPSDVLGKPFEEAYWWSYDPAIRAQLRAAIRRAAAGEIVRYDVPVRVAEDQRILIDFRIVPQRDAEGTVIYLVPSAVDITERERVLRQLRENEERFRATFDYAAVGIAHVGLSGEWLRVNPALCAILGYSREELFGRTFQDITHPADVETDLVRFDRLKRGEISTYAMEKRYFRRNGEIVWAHLTVSLVRDSVPPYCISVIEDITERKRQQEEIESLNVRLQRAMAETHHRVKNNLQVILALIEIGLGDAIKGDPVSSLRRIGQHIRTLADLHDLLTQQASARATTDQISVRVLLERLLGYLRETAVDHSIVSEIEDTVISVRGGASLTLLVNELIANAVKHGRGEVQVRFRVEGGFGELAVRDAGPGFPPGFEPQVSGNTGFSLIESAAQYDLRGTVTYDNHPDGGAQAVVRFPLPA
ncbi:MAG: PAS domain S-box protein [Capsulimonadales bacterium]|nr:PAS domain S-box protein [Capsulimonadales bacterium]